MIASGNGQSRNFKHDINNELQTMLLLTSLLRHRCSNKSKVDIEALRIIKKLEASQTKLVHGFNASTQRK
jgi:hypothetical protein